MQEQARLLENRPRIMSDSKARVDHAGLFETMRVPLLAAAHDALASAYAPYSNFPVGAAVLLSDGTIVHGCNIENASFGMTVCAERVAIFQAVSNGRLDIAAVAVVTNGPKVGTPCGACRQVISEFSPADNPIIVLSAPINGDSDVEPITVLLPHAFDLL